MSYLKIYALILSLFFFFEVTAQKKAHNPIIWADVPDISIIRVGDTYYMSSTVMHMTPGVPIMKSKNLIDWKIVSYAYNILDNRDEFELRNGKNSYGGGTWASSLRYHNDSFYVSTFSNNTGKNYIFSTKDPTKTPWKRRVFGPKEHDHSLFFDDDGRVYMIIPGGEIKLRELKADLTGFKNDSVITIIEDADAIIKDKPKGLPAEGAQMFKENGKYYLFLIDWPKGDMRTELLFRSDNIRGPYEGKVILHDKGIAQGGFVDSPNGKWYGYFFRDYGAVGRVPYIVPMKWENGWPVFGEDGVVPDTLDIIADQPEIPEIVTSDNFNRKPGERALPLQWEWNHNPDNKYWSVKALKGYLRLTTSRIDSGFLSAKNTLTQRTFGPTCSGEIAMDIGHMKDGDFAGIGLLQSQFGVIGVRMEEGEKYIYVENAGNGSIHDKKGRIKEIPFTGSRVYLKTSADYRKQTDEGYFYYSLDGHHWESLGKPLRMVYDLSHFVGYRFAIFNYATKSSGGYVDVDYFKLTTGEK